MEKYTLFFKEEGSKIKQISADTFYLHSTNPMEFSYKQILSLFDQLINIKDSDAIIGFSYSLGSYISNHYEEIKNDKSDQFWNCLMKLAGLIDNELTAFGFCEAVLITSFYCLEIPKFFLDFLISKDKLKLNSLKITLLITLYMDLPFDFIESNSNILMPLISDYFLTAEFPIFKILNLYLADSLKFQPENFPINFETNLFSAMYSILKTDETKYQMMFKPLSKFRKINSFLFPKSSSFIASKINQLSINSIDDILPLIYLLPIFCEEDVLLLMRTITPIISNFIVTQKRLPKLITAAFDKIKNKLDNYSIVMTLYTFCSQIIETEHYPTAIYFISIFLSKFAFVYKRCTFPIIEKLVFGLESEYPFKFPLAFSVYENIELISKMNNTTPSHHLHCNCQEIKCEHCNCQDIKHEHCNCGDSHDDHANLNENGCHCHHHSDEVESNSKSNSENETNQNQQLEEAQIDINQNEIEHDDVEYSNEILFYDHGQCQTFHFNSNYIEPEENNSHPIDNESSNQTQIENESNNQIQLENESAIQVQSKDESICQVNSENESVNQTQLEDESLDHVHSETDFYNILKNRIIPSLIKISISNESMNYHWSFKALRSLVKWNCYDLSEFISYWISNSIPLNHSFLKYLHDSIRYNHHSLNLNQIIEFIIQQIQQNFGQIPTETEIEQKSNENQIDEKLNEAKIEENINKSQHNELNVKQNEIIQTIQFDFLNIILELMKIHQNIPFDLSFNLCKQLLYSTYSKSYVACSNMIHLLFLNRKEENLDFDKIINEFKPIIERLIQIAKTKEIDEMIRAEVVFQLAQFDFINFSHVSNFLIDFLNSSVEKVQIIALMIVENYLINFIDSKNLVKGYELIIGPFLPILYSIIPTSTSIDVINCVYSILITILSSYFPNYKQTINFEIKDQKIIEFLNNSILIVLQGRMILFNHQMPFTYNSLSKKFKFFKYAGLFIVKFPKSPISKHIIKDFSLYLLRVSIEIVPKLLNVLEIGCLFKICDPPIIEFLQTAIMSRVDEDNSYFKIVSKSVSFLLMLKNKYPQYCDLNVYLAFLEKIWEDNSKDDEIIEFLIPIFLTIFSEKSFDVHGNFLIFQEICHLIAKEKFEFDYPKIVDQFLNMQRNNIPFVSFPIHSSLVYVHFLTKPKQTLIESGFSVDQCKEMHKFFKQNIKINKASERFLDNYYNNEPRILEQIKLLKKSPQLPTF